VVTSGGVSVGDYDLVAETLREMGADIRVRRVNMRPGKPFTFAVWEGKPIFALPGNPISCMVTFELFVRPALRKMQGFSGLFHRVITATAAQAIVNGDHRPAYLRVIVTQTEAGSTARLAGDQGSAMMHSMACANGLAFVPGETEIPAGRPVRVLLLAEESAGSSLGTG
jgi:molybdopterin molybdotransferase